VARRFDACSSYLHAYSAHSLKEIYDVHKLDLQAVARSFGFTNPPKVSWSASDSPYDAYAARVTRLIEYGSACGAGGPEDQHESRRRQAEGRWRRLRRGLPVGPLPVSNPPFSQ
jgi:ATP-dependent RNA helicase DDX18/HAS1